MENQLRVPNVSVEIITRKELMARLGISEQHAIKLDKEGKLRSFRIGKACIRYNWQQVLQDLQKTETNAAGK